MKYRLFAVLLALLMIAGMLPSAAFAADGEPEFIPEEVGLSDDPQPEAEPLPEEEYIIPEVIEEIEEQAEEPAPPSDPAEPEVPTDPQPSEPEVPTDPQPEPDPSPEQKEEPSPAPDPVPEEPEEPQPTPEEESDPPAVFEETDGEEDLPTDGQPSLDYVDINGDVRQLSEYVLLTGGSASLEDGIFYVAADVLNLPAGLTVNGTASLLLTDDALLTVSNITLTEGNTLLIYGQQGQSGVLTVTGDQADAAAIGCAAGENCGTLVICGGYIKACGSDGSAGLSAALLDDGPSLTLGGDMLLYVSQDESAALTASTPKAYCAPDAQPMQVVALFSAANASAAQELGVDLSAPSSAAADPAPAAPAAEEIASLSVSLTNDGTEELTSSDAPDTADEPTGSADTDDADAPAGSADTDDVDAPAGSGDTDDADAPAGSGDTDDADAPTGSGDADEAITPAEGVIAMPKAFAAKRVNNALGGPKEPEPVTPPEAPSWTAPEEDGQPHTYPLQLPDDSPLEIVGGETVLTQTDPGKYTVEVKIKDDEKANYKWADGVVPNDDGNVEYTFIIKAIPKVKTEEEEGNFGGIALNLSRAEIESKLLTDADRAALAEGTPVYFWLEAEKITLSGEAKTKCETAANSLGKGVKMPLWLDIRLKKTVQHNDPAHPDVVEDVQPVSGSSVHIKVDVSSANLIDSTRNRTFYRVHYHDGDAKASLSSQGLTDGKYFEFDTDSFSAFGFPYYDVSAVTAIVSSPSRAVIESEHLKNMREGEEYTFTAKVNLTGFYFGRVKVDGELVTEFPGVGTGRASYTFTNKTPLKEHTIEFVMYDSNGAPATGDDSAPGLWAAAAAGAALGLCCLLRRKRAV